MAAKMEERRLEVVKESGSPDSACCTYVFHKEGHTLGNALRYMIMKSPETAFCGYSIPHPSEDKINLRIQTNGAPSIDVLRDGLENLSDVCDHALTTFEASINEFKMRSEKTAASQESDND